jgi:hypothetical protein
MAPFRLRCAFLILFVAAVPPVTDSCEYHGNLPFKDYSNLNDKAQLSPAQYKTFKIPMVE